MSDSPAPVLVTGATGRLGRAVTTHLVTEGFSVRALSRGAREPTGTIDWVAGDIATGTGLHQATSGVSAIVHLASAPYRRGYTREVEIGGTGRLLAAAANAGVEHVIYTSIIGCDKVPWGYIRTKWEAEKIVRNSAVPSSILRLGQFHEFIDQGLTALARTGLVTSDRGFVAQPVDTADAAGRILGMLREGPCDEIVEFGGPEVLDLRTAVEQWLEATGTRRPHLPIHVPGKLGRAIRNGLLATQAEPRGTRTWQDYLKSRYGRCAVG
ncbi:NAD(P)H-binding protein [Pseudonocardia sp. NPDC046786]|uniref:SDR family oxidoreductase n=1 Tax=Pseudonocardia sp. NPDC046786 TaxID=3155471 RepID=UPI0033C3923D